MNVQDAVGGTERGAAAFSDGKSPIGELNELKEKISKREKHDLFG